MKSILLILLVSIASTALAQEVNGIIVDGNTAYRKGDYAGAAELYKKALARDGENAVALYNLAAALHRQQSNEAAVGYFDQVATLADPALKAKACYNKGVLQAMNNQLPEAITSFKQALVLDPQDQDARENLQKAINELRKRQQSTPPPTPNNKQQPPPKKKPSPELLEQKFNELRDKEKQLQQSLQQKSASAQPDKDW